MQLWLQDKLPFTTISIAYEGSAIDIPNVLIDTGSASSIIAPILLRPFKLSHCHRTPCASFAA